MKVAKKQPWKGSRKGFKYELILTLVDRGFSVREAQHTVYAIFSAIKEALLRKDKVELEGFGRWHVKEIPQRRAWRFGKIIQRKPFAVSFEIDAEAFAQASGEAWEPHPGWEARCKQKPKLRGRKLAAFLEEQEEQRRAELLDKYTRLIVRFIRNELYGEDLQMFWILRHKGWFHGPASEVPATERHAVDVSKAAEVIQATKPSNVFQPWPNGTLDGVQWYARWSTRLKVEADIWKEAEQLAADISLGRRR
ncbi:MAG TPA: HU family DNA-binding protein [Verrucomicrobiae bacterium]|nr:HU family DNA-binding protein [Verrucomicrobiae bacterium]